MEKSEFAELIRATRGVEDSAIASAKLHEIFGMRIWDIDLDCAARFLVRKAAEGAPQQVFFVNAHCVNVAARNESYSEILRRAPFVFADGVGMALAARMWGISLVHNVNGTDLFPLLCREAALSGVPIALLGAKPGVAAACAERLRLQVPGLKIVWVEHGYHSVDTEEQRLEELNASGAKILFVAKGVPQQEQWMVRYSGRLSTPVVLGVGALFDFYSGIVPRAPRLIRDWRMEWAFRLCMEPRRLFRRYVIGNPQFLARAVAQRLSG